MTKKNKNIFASAIAGIVFLLGSATPVIGQTIYPLSVKAYTSWDIGSDNNNNVYISWLSNTTLYFAKIVDHAVTGQQTVVVGANTSKYNIPRLSVRPNGQSMSIVYTSVDRLTLKHSWRDSAGVWHNETIVGPLTKQIYFPSGAVDGDGTVHVVYSPAQSYRIYYTYKKEGGSWVTPIDLGDIDGDGVRNDNMEGSRMVVDSNGGIHWSWFVYRVKLNFYYRYAALGSTLDKSTTVKINTTSGMGQGGISVTDGGVVHLSPHFSRNIWHTYKPVGGSFSRYTCATIDDIGGEGELYNAIGAEETGKVYISWSDVIDDINSVRVSVLQDGVWKIHTVDSLAKVGGVNAVNMPTMTMTDNTGYLLWRHNDDYLYLAEYAASSYMRVDVPNGGESWAAGENHDITWTSAGAGSNVNIDYSTNNGSSWTSIASGTANDGTYSWAVANSPSTSCLVRVRDTDGSPSDQSDAVFTITAPAGETVSTPNTPSGPNTGAPATSYDFSTGGSTSSLGDPVQYKFDWNDGSDSGWLAAGTTTASHSWSATGTYLIRAKARCATHTGIESLWSDAHAVSISSGGSSAYYNSPASRLIFTEVNWSSNWTSEVQIIDAVGGTVVQVYYNSGTTRRGPFTLWTNSGGAGRSIRYANILETIDGLDSGTFVYLGTSGALELVTQDGSHLIQAAVRTFNGNNSRTFPAFADVEPNTAASGRQLVIPDISNNATYRPSVALFNPGTESVSAEIRIIGSNGTQVGSTINRTLASYQMDVITAEVRANTYSHANVIIQVTSASGRLLASGQTAHNVSDDPAAHLALQVTTGYPNSPEQRKILPEVNWSSNWTSEVQITDISGGSTVQVYYDSGTNRRGPFTLWSNTGGANSNVTFANILQTIDGLDSGTFTYLGTSGALELITQDSSHLIQGAVRTYNGYYSRTFPKFGEQPAYTAALGRTMLVPNLSNNTTYRPSVVLFNTTENSASVEGRIIGSNGSQIGSTFTRTLVGHEMVVITTEVRANTYSNANVLITVTSGTGTILVTGQTANNITDDPAAHIAVQAQ